MKIIRDKQAYFLVPLALVCSLFLFIGGPGPDSFRSFRYAWGLGHLVCFALWAYIYLLWRSDRLFKQQIMEILILTTLFGGLTELIQSGIGREATWQDLGNDLIGGLLGVALYSEIKKIGVGWPLRIFQATILLLVLWSLIPVGRVFIDDLISWRQFPLLSGFETVLEKTRWSGSAARTISHDIHSGGRSSLCINFTTQRYSGVGLKDFPGNWSGYTAVSLQVYNPDQDPLQLHFRIHDHLHQQHKNAYKDRFNSSFQINPGWNLLEVSLTEVARAPEGRLLDLTHISGMGLFVGKLDRPRTLYIDDVKLIL